MIKIDTMIWVNNYRIAWNKNVISFSTLYPSYSLVTAFKNDLC
jgi:hypothetical protein